MTDAFEPCGANCVCEDYPDERGRCETGTPDCACEPCPCYCFHDDAVGTFAQALDKLSEAAILLGQLLKEIR